MTRQNDLGTMSDRWQVGVSETRNMSGAAHIVDPTGLIYRPFETANLRVADPVIGPADNGAVVINGIVRFGTGLQSYGIGNGAVVGNARGAGAVDLQTSRTAANQVASGANAVNAGNASRSASAQGTSIGQSCVTLTGAAATALGQSASGSGRGAVSIGNSTDASTNHALCLNSDTSTIPTRGALENVTAMGRRSIAQHDGEWVHTGGRINTNGDSQMSHYTWRGETADAIPRFIVNGAGGNPVSLTGGVAYAMRWIVIAHELGGTASAMWEVHSLIRRAAGAVILVGQTLTPIAIDAALVGATVTVVVAAPITTFVQPQVTGVAGRTLLWVISAYWPRAL